MRPIYKNYQIKNKQIAIRNEQIEIEKYGVSAKAYFYWCGKNGSYDNFCKQLLAKKFKFSFSDHVAPMPFTNDKIPAASHYLKTGIFNVYSVKYSITGINSVGADYRAEYVNKNIEYDYTSSYSTKGEDTSKTMYINITDTTTEHVARIYIDLLINKAMPGLNTPPDLIKNYNDGDYNDTIKSLVDDAEKQLD